MQELKKQLIDEMDQQLTSMMADYIEGVELIRVPQKYRSFLGDQTGEVKKKKKLPCGTLPEKEFVSRNSLLTDLFEINHIQTIYHIFIAILILLFMNTVIEDLVDKGRIDIEFTLILWAFGDLQTVLTTWVSLYITIYKCWNPVIMFVLFCPSKVAMMSCTLLIVYPAFHFWSHQRLTIVKSSKRLLWDYFWLACYILYIGTYTIILSYVILHIRLQYPRVRSTPEFLF